MSEDQQLVGAAGRALEQAMQANAAVRARLEATRQEIEQIARTLERATELRRETYLLERDVVERAGHLGDDLRRITEGIAQIDDAISRSARQLREVAATHERDSAAQDPQVLATLAATLAGVDAMTDLTRHSHEGLDHARRTITVLGEQVRPQPAREDLNTYVRAASEHVADAQRQATARAATTEMTAQHAMTLAAMLDARPASTDPGRRPEHNTPSYAATGVAGPAPRW